MSSAPFCTCTDHQCAHHPAGHNKGCTPCVEKNLRRGEVPACLFRKVSEETDALTEYTIEAFVRFALENGFGN